MLSADGSQIKGKEAVITFFNQFFDKNRETKHLWETTQTAKNILETHWAVAGRRKEGSFFAFKGKDTPTINPEGKISYLKVEFL